jgi:trk system potassium uptake protein TrkH
MDFHFLKKLTWFKMSLLHSKEPTRKGKLLSPGRISMLSYAVLILLGAMLLLLPAATVKGNLGFIDALFTSASAVCVTGLIVVDTASTFTFFGKAVIMALIQAGGIGIMVLSTMFLLTLGKRVGRRPTVTAREKMYIHWSKRY